MPRTPRQSAVAGYSDRAGAPPVSAVPDIHSGETSLPGGGNAVGQYDPLDGAIQHTFAKDPTVIKKFLATAAVAVSVAGVSASVAPQAMAIGNDSGTTTLNGNDSQQNYGNTYTSGYMSPSFALIQGSLNKPCLGLPLKANAGSLIGVVPITVQDLNVLSSPQNQQCTENSTQAQGDEPLSHLLDNIPVLTGNGTNNS
jgi:hypothetical protein